ncbi:hypothetical protein NDU88_001126 [Pleurodeles waltl]|uniref:Uncharacterized protein n=1 Tax=Pleurodeles waltl TaxID=8319 RepID=A0AAV7NJ70_PLEWA|nr:hypothetical protein NDU88_001126 [Pleurodeles waltl]
MCKHGPSGDAPGSPEPYPQDPKAEGLQGQCRFWDKVEAMTQEKKDPSEQRYSTKEPKKGEPPLPFQMTEATTRMKLKENMIRSSTLHLEPVLQQQRELIHRQWSNEGTGR